VLRVEDRNGETLEINTTRHEEVLSPETTAIMTSILSDVINSGTATSARWRGFLPPAGGKTGTTDSYTDGWFIGFTPEIVTGVWVGFDAAVPIGEKMEGARVALPIWTEYMIEATKGSASLDFPRPDTIVEATVCSESGMLVRDSCPEPYVEWYKRGTAPTDLCSFTHEERRAEQATTREPLRQSLRDLDAMDQGQPSGDRLRLE